NQVRVEVDDDGEKRHTDRPTARCNHAIATYLGSSASVKSMGGEIFVPVTARRIGMKVLFGPRPVFSTTPISAAWIGSGSHVASFKTAITARTRPAASASSSGAGGSVQR